MQVEPGEFDKASMAPTDERTRIIVGDQPVWA